MYIIYNYATTFILTSVLSNFIGNRGDKKFINKRGDKKFININILFAIKTKLYWDKKFSKDIYF